MTERECRDCGHPVGWDLPAGECPRNMQNYQSEACKSRQVEALRSRIAQLEAVVEAQVLVVWSADILRKRLEDGHARRVYSQLYDAHRARLGAPGQLARPDGAAKAEKESKDG